MPANEYEYHDLTAINDDDEYDHHHHSTDINYGGDHKHILIDNGAFGVEYHYHTHDDDLHHHHGPGDNDILIHTHFIHDDPLYNHKHRIRRFFNNNLVGNDHYGPAIHNHDHANSIRGRSEDRS